MASLVGVLVCVFVSNGLLFFTYLNRFDSDLTLRIHLSRASLSGRVSVLGGARGAR